MADKYFTNTVTPGDYSVAGNWTPANVPVKGDSVFLIDGTASITAGLAQGGVTLVDFTTGPLYRGAKIGSSALAPLVISASGFVTLKSGAYNDVYLEAGAGGIANVIVEMESVQQKVYLVGGTFGLIYVRRGNLRVEGGSIYTKIIIDPVNNDPSQVAVEIDDSVIAAVEDNYGGFVTSGAGPDLALYTGINSTVQFDHGTVDAIDAWGSVTFKHRAGTNVTGTIHMRNKSKLLANEDTRPKTFTTIIKDPGASVSLAATVTPTNDVKDPSGKLVYDYVSTESYTP